MRHITVLFALVIGFAACSGGGPGNVGAEPNADGGQSRDGGRASDAATSDGSIRLGDASVGGGCRSHADCRQSFEQRYAPGELICGGAMPPEECNVDGDCADAGANQICLHHLCGGSSCAAKCTGDDGCKSTSTPSTPQECEIATGRCIPKPCMPDACPQFFVCPADQSQGCLRKGCKSDGDCGGGACVNERCWSGAGTCGEMPS